MPSDVLLLPPDEARRLLASRGLAVEVICRDGRGLGGRGAGSGVAPGAGEAAWYVVREETRDGTARLLAAAFPLLRDADGG
ncbi:MAG: hypothetical protein IRY92_10040 [Dactylosporangium sp.]|nr:hypothetical protein [Dactylosporangium sp.]